MKYNTESLVEHFFRSTDLYHEEDAVLRKIPTITVDNYVILGQPKSKVAVSARVACDIAAHQPIDQAKTVS